MGLYDTLDNETSRALCTLENMDTLAGDYQDPLDTGTKWTLWITGPCELSGHGAIVHIHLDSLENNGTIDEHVLYCTVLYVLEDHV